MGIVKPLKKNSFNRISSKSKNTYLNLLLKIYRFLSRRVASNFCFSVLRRLYMSRKNLSKVSLSRLIRFSSKNFSKTVVIVGKVLNDDRLIKIPKISLCVLEISESARKRILDSGGRILYLEQLASQNPSGKNTLLLRARKKHSNLNKL